MLQAKQWLSLQINTKIPCSSWTSKPELWTEGMQVEF
jgi:hypothetical protein